MERKINIYCDESCHLLHDHEKIMVIGGMTCPKNERKRICREIIGIKKANGIPERAEIKWNKVSACNSAYFKSLIDYFFDNDELSFRAVIVDKTKLNHERFNQTHDEFYYKMYFHCLTGLIDPQAENYIYLDKKDTRGTYKIQKLEFYLRQKTHDFDYTKIKRIQCADSTELPVMQMVDLLIGAIGYHNRDICNPSMSKVDLVKHIQFKSKYSLERSTYLSEDKFNLFFIRLQGNGGSDEIL